MATITDRQMQAKTADNDKWLTHSFKRGAGALVGRITPAGERLFYFRHTDSSGKRRLHPIGPYHPKGTAGLTLAQAFDRASSLSDLYRGGVTDLREHFDRLRQAEADEARAAEIERTRAAAEAEQAALAAQRRVTVRGLFEQWQRAELQPRTLADGSRIGRVDGGEWVRQSFERRVFPRVGSSPAETVTRAELLAILDQCKAEGKLRTTQVLFADLRQMFRFAEEREIVRSNPLASLKRSKIAGKATERDRVLSDQELKALRRATPAARLHPRSEAAIWLCLATGARVGELMGAVWAADNLRVVELRAIASKAKLKFGVVDLDQRTWYLPDTKNQREHTIHLSDFALSVLARLRELREVDADGQLVPWVFPNASRKGPLDGKALGKQIADRQRPPERHLQGRSKLTRALGLDGGRWTPHDLRRTASTLMGRLGVTNDVIDECMNHKLQSRVTRIYVRDRRVVEQQHAFDTLGHRLSNLLDGSNVVPMRTRRV